jgi:hypothetical protein
MSNILRAGILRDLLASRSHHKWQLLREGYRNRLLVNVPPGSMKVQARDMVKMLDGYIVRATRDRGQDHAR